MSAAHWGYSEQREIDNKNDKTENDKNEKLENDVVAIKDILDIMDFHMNNQ